MQPAGFFAEPLRFQALGNGGGESNDVVLHFGFDLVNALRRSTGLFGDGVGGGLGNDAVLGKYRTGRRLHLQPAAILVVVGPDASHRGAGIALDQRQLLDWLSL